MARKATEHSAIDLPVRAGAGLTSGRPRPRATDAEIYGYADTAVVTSLLQKLQLNVLDRRRVQALTGAIAKPVRARRLKRPSDRAANIFGNPNSAQAEVFLVACWAFIEFFTVSESINSDKIVVSAADSLRSALRRMKEEDRKKTIMGLMAYVGELQASGVLENVPSDRLARVAKLIGEAAEIVSADPTKLVPLFRERAIDPATDKKPTALEWFDLVWKPRVEAGEATGDDIRGIDPAFYNNFAAALSKRGKKIRDYLPPSPTRGKKDETPKQRAERLRKSWRESKRRSRGQQSEPS